MFVLMVKIMRKTKILGICIICFCLKIAFTAVEVTGNEGAELPTPISFKCDTRLIEKAVLIDTIDFELSESNDAITYPISETDSDLIFMFHDVSTAINVSLIIEKDSKYCVGFSGESATIYAQINPNLEHEFELSLGSIGSDDMKQTEIVNYCSGVLEIYQVTS